MGNRCWWKALSKVSVWRWFGSNAILDSLLLWIIGSTVSLFSVLAEEKRSGDSFAQSLWQYKRKTTLLSSLLLIFCVTDMFGNSVLSEPEIYVTAVLSQKFMNQHFKVTFILKLTFDRSPAAPLLNLTIPCYVACSADCVVGEWSQWSPCTNDCKRGRRESGQHARSVNMLNLLSKKEVFILSLSKPPTL